MLWAAKNEKSKHLFNYKAMREEAGGRQMKTVWTMTAPKNGEKQFGKHPTQKPIALIGRCLRASTRRGDLILDPFMGAGSTGLACIGANRKFVGIELNSEHVQLATKRIRHEIMNSLPLEVKA